MTTEWRNSYAVAILDRTVVGSMWIPTTGKLFGVISINVFKCLGVLQYNYEYNQLSSTHRLLLGRDWDVKKYLNANVCVCCVKCRKHPVTHQKSLSRFL